MSQDPIHRLQAVLTDLHGDAGRIERVGRALTPAELRRAQSLRAAAALVERAIHELAADQGAYHGAKRTGDSVGGVGGVGGEMGYRMSGDDGTRGDRRRSGGSEEGAGGA
jgi:hypothetical protein